MTETIVPTAIHRISTVHPGARRSYRALAECPRQTGSVEVDICTSCEHARGFVGSSADGSRQALCVRALAASA